MLDRRHAFGMVLLAGATALLVCASGCGEGEGGSGPGIKPDTTKTDTTKTDTTKTDTTKVDTTKTDTTKVDTTKIDTAKADSLKAAKDLARFAKAMARIPVPLGTRYFYAPKPAPKTAAALACKGQADIFAIPANARGILGIDTVSYFDSLGVAHCAHQNVTLREDHARFIFDTTSGQAWERIRIDITPDDLLPRYRYHGTGRIKLISGLEADIAAYDLDMALDNSTGTPIIRDAHLRLAAADGHIVQLDLTISHPYRAADFYPTWDVSPPGPVVMSGPVLLGTDTVGRAMLFGDHSLSFKDRSGNPVTPQ
jgi:hypothetical protein